MLVRCCGWQTLRRRRRLIATTSRDPEGKCMAARPTPLGFIAVAALALWTTACHEPAPLVTAVELTPFTVESPTALATATEARSTETPTPPPPSTLTATAIPVTSTVTPPAPTATSLPSTPTATPRPPTGTPPIAPPTSTPAVTASPQGEPKPAS